MLNPVTPAGEAFRLRPLRLADEEAFYALRLDNAAWLGPWDSTSPDGSGPTRSFADLVRTLEEEARAGRSLPFAIELGGVLAGQLTLSNISMGAFRSATAGYWIARAAAGRGIIPTALAAATDHLIATRGLHRLEVNIRPENAPSLAVVRKLGLRDEGLRPRLLHIDGAWRDHRSFAVTVEELDGGTLTDRLFRMTDR